MNNRPAIAAAVEIKPGRFPDLTYFDLYRRIIAKLVADWNLKPGMIDGIYAPPLDIEGGPSFLFGHQRLADLMGITPRVALTMSAGGATFGYMVQNAALSIEAGKADAILCIGAGKFAKVKGTSAAHIMARSVTHPSFESIYAPVIPALYGQYATRYMHEYGVSPDDMAAVTVSARKWARINPDAIAFAKDELTVENVLASRIIASPFHYLHCSIPCEGGGAVLVTNGALARTLSDQPAYLLGMGEHHGYGYVSQNPALGETGASAAAHEAFRTSGLVPREIDSVQLYDAFAINPLILLEDIGFSQRGRAAEMFHVDRTAPGGDFAVNTNGGLIGFGHTGDSSGMSMIVEGALQVMGRGCDRQVNATTCLIHSYGGMMTDHSTLILGREAS